VTQPPKCASVWISNLNCSVNIPEILGVLGEIKQNLVELSHTLEAHVFSGLNFTHIYHVNSTLDSAQVKGKGTP
jgi:hypothetical protein